MNIARGIVLGADRANLIVRATESETALFSKNAEVVISQPDVKPQDVNISLAEVLQNSGLLYDAHGKPIAMVTSVSVTSDRIDVTMASDVTPQYISGPRHIHLTAVGLGG